MCPSSALGRSRQLVSGERMFQLVRHWAEARRWAVILAIGALEAWLWIRLGLYGFGLAVAAVVALPVLYLAWRYLGSGRRLDAGVVLASFAGVWATFEAARWLNAASDPAVSIPGWSPFPLATALGLLIVSIAIAASGLTAE
jgi:hypothetical protein